MPVSKHITRVSVAAALTAVGLVAGSGFVSAQTVTNGQSSTATKPKPAAWTDTQKACMAAKGFSAPTRPAAKTGGTTVTSKPTTPRSKPTQAERDAKAAARQAAATACGVTLPAGGGKGGHGGAGGRSGHGPALNLTDAQKTCLTSKGVTVPSRAAKSTGAAATSTPSSKPARKSRAQSDAERAAFNAAATACGITLPAAPAKRAASTTATTTATTIKA